jgi:cytochrome c-type biogenesis protein CcmH
MINKKKIIMIIFCVSQLFINNCYSVEPNEILDNEKQELRARKISKNLRCMICQNQSIDESSAPLAKDMRILVRDKIKEGNSDKEIYDFLIARYGDFILLNPPFKISTYILWLFPFTFLIVGVFILFFHNKKFKLK